MVNMTAHMPVMHLCIPSQGEVVFFSFSKAAKGPAAMSCSDLDFCPPLGVVDQLFWPDSPTSATAFHNPHIVSNKITSAIKWPLPVQANLTLLP